MLVHSVEAVDLSRLRLSSPPSRVVRSSMCDVVLHPHHKLEYFKKAAWPASWCSTAKDLVRTTYELSYANRTDLIDASSSEDESGKDNMVSTQIYRRNMLLMLAKPSDEEDKNIFDNLPSLTKPQTSRFCDELAVYLLAPIEEAEDPILWWSEHRAVYPQLLHMALDYLTIPGKSSIILFMLSGTNRLVIATSVQVEWLFSHGQILLLHTCNCLSGQTTHALLCLRDWSSKGFVKNEDIKTVSNMDEVQEDDESEHMPEGWDSIE